MARRRKYTYKVKSENVYAVLSDMLKDYGDDVNEKLKVSIPYIAERALKKVKNASPSKSGYYRKGWTVNLKINRLGASAIIHNDKAYQLTHLLEYGHIDWRTGRRVGQKPHIKAINDDTEKELKEAVKAIV